MRELMKEELESEETKCGKRSDAAERGEQTRFMAAPTAR